MATHDEKHIVVEGDRISRIAATRCTTIEKLLAHNPHLADEDRRNPEMLLPGEALKLPPRDERPFDADERRCTTVAVEKIPSRLQLRLQLAGMPLKPQAFQWKLGRDPYPGDDQDTSTWTRGDVTAEGLVEFDVPPTATEVVIYLPALRFEFLARIGHLHPHTARSGVQQRLNNLGYATPVTSPAEDPALAAASSARLAHAIRRFQEHHGMHPAGANTPELQKKLRAVHEPPPARPRAHH